jgi:hypothetical protein
MNHALIKTSAVASVTGGYKNNLGNYLTTRFNHTGQLEDVEQAILLSGSSVEESAVLNPGHSSY